MTNFNISPYYDDYSEEKKFLRLLFRPGRAVQSRELTQIQTVLQKQVERMGNHLFKEGTMIVPGQSSIDLNYHYVKLQEQFNSTDIDVNQLVGRTIAGNTSGAVADVVKVSPAELGDPNTIFVKYRAGNSSVSFTANTTASSATVTNVTASVSNLKAGMKISGTGVVAGTVIRSVIEDSNGISLILSQATTATGTAVSITGVTSSEFLPNETLETLDSDSNGVYYVKTAISSPCGMSSAASIESGIYYVNGFFCVVDAQSIILDKYSNTPTYKIGFDVQESFVNSLDDTSLNDPAQGSVNANAPGADRYKIELILDKIDIDSVNSSSFIEIMRIRNGSIEYKIEHTAYNEIEDTLARRTYDESGNYTVRHFPIQIREHLKTGDNQGIYTALNGGDATKLAIGLEPGKAYVKGYEIETLSTRYVDVLKGRQTALSNNLPIRAEIGNYVNVNNVRASFDITNYEVVNLKDATSGSGSIVGTARVKAFSYITGTIGSSAVYRLYLFDINMNSGKTFANDVKSIVSASGTPTAIADVVLEVSQAVLKNSSVNTAIFQNPQSVIATYNNGLGVDTNYAVNRLFSGTMTETSGNAITFTAGSNEVFSSYSATNYHLSIVSASATATSNGYSAGSVIDINSIGSLTVGGSPTGKQITINLPAISGSTIELIAKVNKTISTEKTKTLNSNYSETLSAASTIQLSKADIYRIISIKIGTSSGEDVTSRYRLDNGQRDNFYDRGSLILNSGSTLPSGSLYITYDYFEHGSGDYFSVDSYAGVIPYEDIPSFVSPTTGKQYNLRDCLDFRPRMNSSGTGFSTLTETVIPDEDITVDFTYYLPRIDKIFLDSEGEFKVKQGVSSLQPKAPSDPVDGMAIYTINIPAYTFSAKDVSVNYIENKNYTMRDIGALEKRIENVEYYTSLNLLEKATTDLFIDDGTGENRFKNGFLVDNFTGHNVGDVNSSDYICSIDSSTGTLRPAFVQKNANLKFVSSDSSNFSKKGDLLTLPYTTSVLIEQPFMSTAENVNPYQVTNWVGSVTLDPPSDTWRDVTQRPDIVINQDGNYDQVAAMADETYVMGTIWNEWETSWTGSQYSLKNGSSINTASGTQTAYAKNHSYVQAINIGETRTGIRTTIVPDIVTQTVDSKIIEMSIIPYMRSIDITFTGKRFKPLTRLYPFFDGQAVSDYTRPIVNGTAVNFNDPIYTNVNGEVAGVFTIPNNSNMKFRTGQRLFRLTDSATNSQGDVTTSGQETFSATGTIETRQDTVLSIRNAKIEQTVVTEDRTITTWWDPLAQSFLINQEGGVFLDSIDLYFASKDDSGIPVTLQIRNMVNGTPGQKVVPFSEVILNPEQVNVSSDVGSVPVKTATTFSFSDPVYLENGVEYCFVVLTNSQGYRLWTAELGEVDVTTGARISENPYAGVMFKSQNASTWTPIQEQDITFSMKRCVFNTGVSGQVKFVNDVITNEFLPENPFSTTIASTDVTVNHPNHGLLSGSNIAIGGVVGAQNGVPASELNKTHTVSDVTVDSYKISVTTPATSTGNVGGLTVYGNANYRMDTMNVIAQELILPNTQIGWTKKTTDTTYTKDSGFTDFAVNTNVIFDSPCLIANESNETSYMSGMKSFEIIGTLKSTSDNISPIIDTTRMSVITVNNRINNTVSGENSASGGSSLARYMTRRISLSDPAIALKVYMDMSVPTGANVMLYYKTLRDDANTLYEDVNWTEMDIEKTIVPTTNQSQFTEYSWIADNLEQFSTYAIKIVFTSSSTSKVPLVRNFRTIALGT